MSAGLLAFTLFHTAISLVAIVIGFGLVARFVTARPAPRSWISLFLWTTVATSVTGFLFPFRGLEPPHILGIIALVVLVPTCLAFYRFATTGTWRWVFALGYVVSLYLNVFVLIVQAFQKVPALRRLAPTQSEPPFQIAQLVALLAFVVLAVLSIRRFQPATA